MIYKPLIMVEGSEPVVKVKQRAEKKPAKKQREIKSRGENFKPETLAFLNKQEYIGITSMKMAWQAYKEIRELAKTKRISADMEDGLLDEKGQATKDGTGKSAALVYGFCGTPGRSYIFPLEHPDAPVNRRTRIYCRRIVRRLLKDPNIRFVFQHGSYDVTATKKLLNATVACYDYDTNYAEFFRYPERFSFSLENIVQFRFPQFAGYKEMVAPHCFTDEAIEYFAGNRLRNAGLSKQFKAAKKSCRNGLNYALIPWDIMVLYNGADNDVQKRIEITTKKDVSLPLLHVYQDAQFVLNTMEELPPLFDYKQYDQLISHYPVIKNKLWKKLVKIVGREDFNPNSPTQVSHVIYKQLKLPKISEIPNTRKETMAVLAEYHPFPALLTEYRRVAKICSTYLNGFKTSADLNKGRVRTIWWLTGTRTGRLSSGGGDSGESGVVNLQNIHGDPLLQCLLVSDLRWREIYKYWKEHGDFTEKSWQQFGDFDVFLGFDHSQMELRVVAQKSGDKNLIAAFKSGVDIHAQVGHELTGWPVEQIQNDEAVRRLIKNMQFGIVFGLNENNLADYMRAKGVKDVDDDQVRKFYRLYFKRFSGVKKMIAADREFVADNGYVVTLFGFKRKLNTEGNDRGGAFWGNQAVNTPIQGTAHQLMLMGLIPLKRKPKTYKLLNRPQLEIHDAIYFVVKLKEMFKAAVLGQYMLEKESVKIVKKDFDLDWKVPLKAEPKGAFRFGVQIKNVGIGKGPKTEWEFLNEWCKANQKLQVRFQKEHKEI